MGDACWRFEERETLTLTLTCWSVGTAHVVVVGPPAACFAVGALALAVDVLAGRNEGCAVIRAGAALQALAASTAATARRMDAIPSGCGLGAGDCRGLVTIRLSRRRMWPAAACRGGLGLRSARSGLGLAGLLFWSKLPGDDHTHAHNRTPQLRHYAINQSISMKYTKFPAPLGERTRDRSRRRDRRARHAGTVASAPPSRLTPTESQLRQGLPRHKPPAPGPGGPEVDEEVQWDPPLHIICPKQRNVRLRLNMGYRSGYSSL